jgi:peptidoglycan hydrolase-like protein with peptidoglycan-binding domain
MALSWPLEQEGSEGENVRSIQYLINAHISDSSDAVKSPDGSAAAKRGLFGRRRGSASEGSAGETSAVETAVGQPLQVDGIFGPKTDAAVRAFQAEHDLGVDGKVGNQTWPVLIIQVSAGSTGDAVRGVQSQIHSRSGWLTIDGIFGPETEAAVRSFQSFCELSVDGIAGINTWNALTLPYLRANNGQAASDVVYQAWTKNDRATAAYEAIPLAIDTLFARTWHASDGWAFAGCGVAAGTFGCTWQRTGEKLILEGNDSTGAPFFYVNNVTFEA